MGKQKQQVISRFFAPKPLPNPQPETPTKPPPKISATISFSPQSKRNRPQTLTPIQSPSPPPDKKLKTLNESLHQRFLQKFLQPDPPLSTSPAPSTQNPKYTPLEQQVVELKSKYPDVLLMFEVGYRYRFFGDDAETAARLLGIIAHADHNFLTASVPTFRLNFHVRRLVGAGCKVGVVKQTETAAIKAHGSNRLGPFSRDLSALYTRSTVEAAKDMGGTGEEDLGVPSSNYLLCVVEKEILQGQGDSGMAARFDVKIGIVGVEISTGEVIYGEFIDDVTRSGLEAVILSLSPIEILLGQPLLASTEKLLLAYSGPTSDVRVEHTSRDCFDDGGALAEVMSLYEKTCDDRVIVSSPEQSTEFPQEDNHQRGLEGIMAMPGLAVQALALTIRYLKQFGFERIIHLGASFRPFSSSVEMTLSANTLDQLEVLKNNSDGSPEGSLLQAMNHTYTPFGARLLKHWVSHPLRDRHSILSRLDAVNEIAESMGSIRPSLNFVLPDEDVSAGAVVNQGISYLLSSVLKVLRTLPDVQRGITRIFHGTATANEFISAMHAIVVVGKRLQQLHVEDDGNGEKTHGKSVQSALLKRLISTASSSTVISLAAKLLSSLNKDAADQGDVLNLFNVCSGQFPEVARGRTTVQIAKEKLDLLIGQYRKQLGMPKLDFMSVSGTTHLIELPSDRRVPSNWVKISSTKKMIRYHPPEVLTALDELLLAKEELAVASKSTWRSFLMGFGKYYAQFQSVVQSLAALDCLHSLAILSRNQNYVRPIFIDDDEPSQLCVQSGRHPVLELTLGDNFVPNDTNLHSNGEYCQIITGPNMGGKSCYIRQVALLAVMAHVGSFVPATSAKFRVLDGIYTRMGALDSIRKGTSTFFEELSETSHILQHCSSRSLVIIDELGLGTSTHDGVAIAYATLHHLLEQKKCMVLFVTHYPEIMNIQNEFVGSVGTYHVAYLTSSKTLGEADSKSDQSAQSLDLEDVTFLYKVIHGATDKSFGLNVARLAQIPSSCIARATVMAATLEMELCTRGETQSAWKLLTDVEAHPIQNHPSSLEISWRDEKEPREGLHRLFSCLKAVSIDGNPGNALFSLKNASDLALKMINWERN